MIDTATAKQLLQSNDVSELQAVVVQYKNHEDSDAAMQSQILKLLLLLQSRILQLQTAAKSPATELSVSYAGMARCWMLLGDIEKCQGQVNKALALDSDNVDALLLEGELQSAHAKYEDAIEFTEKAITLLQTKKKQGELAVAYSKLAATYEMMGDFNQAVSVLQKALNECDHSDPLCPEAVLASAVLHGHMGTIQEKLGNYQDAVSSLTVAASAYQNCYGKDHAKTQEIEFLLEMASSTAK